MPILSICLFMYMYIYIYTPIFSICLFMYMYIYICLFSAFVCLYIYIYAYIQHLCVYYVYIYVYSIHACVMCIYPIYLISCIDLLVCLVYGNYDSIVRILKSQLINQSINSTSIQGVSHREVICSSFIHSLSSSPHLIFSF